MAVVDNLILVNNDRDIAKFLQWLGSVSVIGLDTETTGISYEDTVRLVQFADRETGWAVPVDVLETLPRYWCGYTLVGHNIPFDLFYLQKAGFNIPWDKVHDTQLMAEILFPGDPHGLKPLAKKYIDPASADNQSDLKKLMRKNKWDWSTIPIETPEYWMYGAMDPILTVKLFDKLYPAITQKFGALYELERDISRILFHVKKHGFKIDTDYTQKMSDKLGSRNEELKGTMLTMFGIENPNSNRQVTDALIQRGVSLHKKTPSGQWAFDSTVSDNLKHPIAVAVSEIKRNTKLKSSYFDNFLEMKDENNYLHASVRQMGARTGRMSVVNPALQTIPRGSIVRNSFLPSDENQLLSVDYDQVEMRLMAHFSKDPGLIEAIRSGDIHTVTAQKVYNDPLLDKHDPRRQLAKNAGFAKIYGAGIKRFAETAGTSIKKAKHFLTEYDKQFPGVSDFMKQVEYTALDRYQREGIAYVKTPLGRYQPSDSTQVYRLVNYLIQGTAADLFKQAIVRMDKEGITPYMVMPIHDEMVFDIPKDIFRDVERVVLDLMPDSDSFVVPLTCEASEPLERWGDK